MKAEREAKPFSILIVDDEPKNIQLLGNILTNEAYEVEFATDGEGALEWVAGKKFDLILLDVMMPGMDGYTVCRKIKSNDERKNIPIIFLTAKSESEDIVEGFNVGGSDYITKPFKTPELLARIKMHVEMKTLRGLLPICANCKDVRDDEGTWKRIETYIEEHSNALFSHGLCSKCEEEIYGDQEWYQKRNKKR